LQRRRERKGLMCFLFDEIILCFFSLRPLRLCERRRVRHAHREAGTDEIGAHGAPYVSAEFRFGKTEPR